MTQETLRRHQGETIARAMIDNGYEVKAMSGCDLIAWQVTRTNEEWWAMLAWIPRPVEQWRILPVCSHQHEADIYKIIEQTIGGRR